MNSKGELGGSVVSEVKYRLVKTRGACAAAYRKPSSGREPEDETAPREQKVNSHGRMLGYRFFSLLSSLLASSYVPWA